MTTKKLKPEYIWAFWANPYGPFFNKPRRCKREDLLFPESISPKTNIWWEEKQQNDEITKIGLYQRGNGYITFSHENKEEVEKFIVGFMTHRKLIKEICDD